MTGTSPTKATIAAHLMSANDGSHIVVREFRGAQLVLIAYDGRGGFLWRNVMLTDDKHKPLRMPHGFALRIADKASREYGAKCATLSADGTLTQPASAVAKERERLIVKCYGTAAITTGTLSEQMRQLGEAHSDIPPAYLAEALYRLDRITRAEWQLIEANGFDFEQE